VGRRTNKRRRPSERRHLGEQQILALARCLVGRPRLMLLDEPSEGIQPSLVEQIIYYLRDFRQRWNLEQFHVK
jgi:branched-chain amino acid transport system ATP-binding protein/urea transport system ATP-binding protein